MSKKAPQWKSKLQPIPELLKSQGDAQWHRIGEKIENATNLASALAIIRIHLDKIHALPGFEWSMLNIKMDDYSKSVLVETIKNIVHSKPSGAIEYLKVNPELLPMYPLWQTYLKNPLNRENILKATRKVFWDTLTPSMQWKIYEDLGFVDCEQVECLLTNPFESKWKNQSIAAFCKSKQPYYCYERKDITTLVQWFGAVDTFMLCVTNHGMDVNGYMDDHDLEYIFFNASEEEKKKIDSICSIVLCIFDRHHINQKPNDTITSSFIKERTIWAAAPAPTFDLWLDLYLNPKDALWKNIENVAQALWSNQLEWHQALFELKACALSAVHSQSLEELLGN